MFQILTILGNVQPNHHQLTQAMMMGQQVPPPAHSGTKCLKPARNRFISVRYIIISRFFKAIFNISVSGKWMNFIFKIRQIVAGRYSLVESEF